MGTRGGSNAAWRVGLRSRWLGKNAERPCAEPGGDGSGQDWNAAGRLAIAALSLVGLAVDAFGTAVTYGVSGPSSERAGHKVAYANPASVSLPK